MRDALQSSAAAVYDAIPTRPDARPDGRCRRLSLIAKNGGPVGCGDQPRSINVSIRSAGQARLVGAIIRASSSEVGRANVM